MRNSILALLLALAAAPALAADAVPIKIPASEAAQHVNQTATVTGVLTNVHMTGGKSFLWDIGGTYPDNPFTVYVAKKDTDVVPNVTPLIGKTLSVTGQIKLYQGKPEIAVSDPKQVQVAQ